MVLKLVYWYICDGCAANLTTIKITHGCSGAYSILKEALGEKYEIKPWMINPFRPPDLIYWMVCSTYQVCMYSSISSVQKTPSCSLKHDKCPILIQG